jgi:hypothetical protein
MIAPTKIPERMFRKTTHTKYTRQRLLPLADGYFEKILKNCVKSHQKRGVDR